ncbi:hypothetical protein G9U52_12250 [Paenibacillus sp. S3N08]|uniref:Uncharacterized protein n=1 Tax=Paenibacillus agricola TaxID=2716264 RepID=A0ABX0J4N3_9BACL|nr:hypothetical protein [Paenibacillus agricola]
MPYVIKHKQTSELYTCTMVNGYRLPYYGTKNWEYVEDAEADYAQFLVAQGEAELEEWELLELSENQLKMCNVKLKNDPKFKLHWDEVKQSGIASISPLIS